MPFASGADKVEIHYEEIGSGVPIIFVHEFGSDLREWEPQIRWFSREYRCIRFNARGYPPSDVPTNDDQYGQTFAADDILSVLDEIGVQKAHVVGLSMGGIAALLFGLQYPERTLSLTAAGAGSGSPKAHQAYFQKSTQARADMFLTEGSSAVAQELGFGPTRIQLLNKDPRGWHDFVDHLGEHSALGSALTLKNYQLKRTSFYEREAQFEQCMLPTFLVVGDEDDPCLEVNLFLKRKMPNAKLWMVPGTGHAVNLEEPAAFNDSVHRFISSVDRGIGLTRDPRTRSTNYA